MKKIVVHHIELSHTSPYITGGEKALVEIVRYFSRFDNLSQYIYTSESGANVYKKQLKESAHLIQFVIIGRRNIEEINPYLAFYLRVFQQFNYLRRFDKDAEHTIFSHEEFLPTLIFSYLLKKINSRARWFVFFHVKCPSIWKGFEGEYTGKFKFPSLRLIRYKLEQWLFLKLTRKNVAKVITVNYCYEDFLKKYYKKESIYVIKTYSGVTIPVFQDNSSKKKEYDLVFMARFNVAKGIFEIIDILKKLKKVKTGLRLAILGGGDSKMERKFFKLVEKNGLKDNIDFLGYIISDDKYKILQHSMIFLFPSYFESFGQAALEAMKCGLPVVAYDLASFQFYTKGMIKVPILDNDKMAKEILELLNNKVYYDKTKKDALDFASNFSWDKTSEEMHRLIIEK